MTRIAIADDEPLERELVIRALRRPELEVRQAASGSELLELLRRDPPFDLVVTDVSMPRMSGLQVLAAVRAAGIEVPFLVISARVDPILRGQIAEFAQTRFLSKPLEVSSLRECVAALLGDPT
jgi:two-component system phosphate regulon response regulator OmpR